MRYKIITKKGNVSPTGRYYSATISPYSTKWKVGYPNESFCTEYDIRTEEVVRINV